MEIFPCCAPSLVINCMQFVLHNLSVQSHAELQQFITIYNAFHSAPQHDNRYHEMNAFLMKSFVKCIATVRCDLISLLRTLRENFAIACICRFLCTGFSLESTRNFHYMSIWRKQRVDFMKSFWQIEFSDLVYQFQTLCRHSFVCIHRQREENLITKLIIKIIVDYMSGISPQTMSFPKAFSPTRARHVVFMNHCHEVDNSCRLFCLSTQCDS